MGGDISLDKGDCGQYKDKIPHSTIYVMGIVRGNGPIAQLAEPPAHNRSVPGSNPGGPTNYGGMKIGVYYIRQPVEWKNICLSEGQGSVWQWKTEIPRDSGKGCGKEAAPFFYALRSCQDRDRVKKTCSTGVMEYWKFKDNA
jgi:hypothetical protein